jgi:hypothetical protein
MKKTLVASLQGNFYEGEKQEGVEEEREIARKL